MSSLLPELVAALGGVSLMNNRATKGAANSISTIRMTWAAMTNVTSEPEPTAVPSTA